MGAVDTSRCCGLRHTRNMKAFPFLTFNAVLNCRGLNFSGTENSGARTLWSVQRNCIDWNLA
jgi:hypothetical protein